MGAAARELDQGEVLFEPGAGPAFVAQLTGPWRHLAPMSSMLSELGAQPGTRRLAYATAQSHSLDSIGGLVGRGRYGDAGGAHNNRAMVFNFLGIGRERVRDDD